MVTRKMVVIGEKVEEWGCLVAKIGKQEYILIKNASKRNASRYTLCTQLAPKRQAKRNKENKK